MGGGGGGGGGGGVWKTIRHRRRKVNKPGVGRKSTTEG